MATLRQIVRRIKSIQSTAKTTRAMSLVAGSKMRRAQQMALAHRPYADELATLLAHVVETINTTKSEEGEILHPLLEQREMSRPGLLLITADRGLCGGLNTALIRAAGAFITAHPNTKLITVGRKGNDFYRRTNADIIGSFMRLGDYPSFDDVRPVTTVVSEAFISGEIDGLVVIYPRFINTVIQRPEQQQLLPIQPPEQSEEERHRATEYIYEPDPKGVLEALLPRYVEIQVYRAVLELAASYQSAQMVAMRNATDAANEMVQVLTLERNKVRQEQITKELLDITGGVEAMNG